MSSHVSARGRSCHRSRAGVPRLFGPASTIGSALTIAAVLGLTASLPAPGLADFAPHAFVVTTDFGATGSSTAVAVDVPWSADVNVEGVGSDPMVRHFLGRHYVVNRFLGDNVQIIDPATFATIRQFSTGAGTNPHDIAVVSETKAYVTAYDGTDLLIVDPSTGVITGAIDLAAFGDGDGLPEMNTMQLDGDRLFVQLQRLDRDDFYNPVFPSYLAVIDVTTDTIVDADPGVGGVQAIVLTGMNPVCKMALDAAGGRLYVAEVGTYGGIDGGIDVVDTDVLTALGFVLSEASLGGDVGCLAMCSGTSGYVLSSTDFFYTSHLRAFDVTGGLGTVVHTTASYTEAMACDADSDQLFLGVRDVSAPGVRVFDASSGDELTGAPINVGLPPVDLVVARPQPLGADDIAASSPPGISAAPNPFRSAATIRFAAAPGDRIRAEVFDAGGRSVRVLANRLDARNGWNTLTWDATDDAGGPVAPGAYWLRLTGGRASLGVTASGSPTSDTRAPGSSASPVIKLIVAPR